LAAHKAYSLHNENTGRKTGQALEVKLREEASGILNWLLESTAARRRKEGLKALNVVLLTTENTVARLTLSVIS
jgi:hypothetical protein